MKYKRIVYAFCGCPFTDEHRNAISCAQKNPAVEIVQIPLVLNDQRDLVNFLSSHSHEEYVYVAAYGRIANIMQAAHEAVKFSFFDTGSDGRLRLYDAEAYCHPKLVYIGQPKAMAATLGSEYHKG